uniref:Uncharacterized protein n=1 Tax=Cacopsylla melanoneura TaxID=428564 RepID=A0A8D9EHC1_9HEMI
MTLRLALVFSIIHLTYGIGVEDTTLDDEGIFPEQSVDQHAVLPEYVKNEIMRTFLGVTNETLLIDFLNNESYVETLMSIQLQMCFFDALETHQQKSRKKRNLFSMDWFWKMFPKDFWVKDVHKGYYHYLKHLDPVRWWNEAYEWVEIKSSLPPLYYLVKYCPNELRFLKDNDYHEEYYPNLTWPPGLDPLWTGPMNMTTNLFSLVTSSSSSETVEWYPYSGESTTTCAPSDVDRR